MRTENIPKKTLRAIFRFLDGEGAGMPSAAETGIPAGSIIVGVCECNWGLVIRVLEDMAPCYDPMFHCRHTPDDAFNAHNFVVFPGSADEPSNGSER